MSRDHARIAGNYLERLNGVVRRSFRRCAGFSNDVGVVQDGIKRTAQWYRDAKT